MAVPQAGTPIEKIGPALAYAAVDLTTTDATYTPGFEPRGFWVGGAGHLKIDGYDAQGAPTLGVVLSNLPVGRHEFARVTKVWKVGTTATLIVALF